MKVLDLFSGIGGFSLGLERAGMETVAFCEIEEYPQKVLRKHWPGVPIYDDVRGLTAERLIRDGVRFDIMSAGFPCQDLSVCGKQAGFGGERSSLYSEVIRIARDTRPKWVVFENVTGLLTGDDGRWFSRFLNDLASIGYDAEWHCISASATGAAHHRDRVWIVAYPNSANVEGSVFSQSPFIDSEESRRRQHSRAIDAAIPANDYAKLRPDFDGVSEWMDELQAYGNAVYPQIPEIIGRAIMEIEGVAA
jgi:DNA (cytosine-5)-methyltransferase 1